MEINIGAMKLNNADHGGIVSLGSTEQTNRQVAAKKTQGFGQQFGDRVWRVATVQWVRDDEASDSCSMKTGWGD